MKPSHSVIGLPLFMAMAFAGCSSSSDAPVLVPAAGVVTHEGKPLADADLMFYPKKGPMAIGRSDEEGRFTLKTNGKSGALAGTHQVTVTVKDPSAKPAMLQDPRTAPTKPLFPSKYASQATTTLKVDIASGDGEITLDVTD